MTSLLGSKKHIEHSDPDVIKLINENILLHGSNIHKHNNNNNNNLIEGHVAVFSINPGQEIFSEKITLIIERFENSKVINSLFDDYIKQNKLDNDVLINLVKKLFRHDSFLDTHFGIAASSLLTINSHYDRLAGIIDYTSNNKNNNNNKNTNNNNNNNEILNPKYGLFMGCCLMRHSCNPNVELTLNETKDSVTIRAIKYIPQGAEITRDLIAEHYHINYHNKTINKKYEISQRKNNLDLEHFDLDNTNSFKMNKLIGGLSYDERNIMHKQLFGCNCSCYWCNKCQDDNFRKSDDFIRKSINLTHFNADMIDMGTIPETKVNMLQAAIKLMENAYIDGHYCNVPALCRAYVQLSAAMMMCGMNTEGSESLRIAASCSILCRGKNSKETHHLLNLLHKRNLQAIPIEKLIIFQGQDNYFFKIKNNNNNNNNNNNILKPLKLALDNNTEINHHVEKKQEINSFLSSTDEINNNNNNKINNQNESPDKLHSSGELSDIYSDSLANTPRTTIRNMKTNNSKLNKSPKQIYSFKKNGRKNSIDSDSKSIDSTKSLEEEIVGKLRENKITTENPIKPIEGMYFERELIPPTLGPIDSNEINNHLNISRIKHTRGEEKGAVNYDELIHSQMHRVSRTREGVSVYRPLPGIENHFYYSPPLNNNESIQSDNNSYESNASAISGPIYSMWGVRINSDLSSLSSYNSTNQLSILTRNTNTSKNSKTTSYTNEMNKPEHLRRPPSRLYNNSSSQRKCGLNIVNKDAERSIKRWSTNHINIIHHSSINPKEKYSHLLTKNKDNLNNSNNSISTDNSINSNNNLQNSTQYQYDSDDGDISLSSSFSSLVQTPIVAYNNDYYVNNDNYSYHQQPLSSKGKRIKATYYQKQLLLKNLVDSAIETEKLKHRPDKLEPLNTEIIETIKNNLNENDSFNNYDPSHYFHPLGVQTIKYTKRNIKISERLLKTKNRKITPLKKMESKNVLDILPLLNLIDSKGTNLNVSFSSPMNNLLPTLLELNSNDNTDNNNINNIIDFENNNIENNNNNIENNNNENDDINVNEES